MGSPRDRSGRRTANRHSCDQAPVTIRRAATWRSAAGTAGSTRSRSHAVGGNHNDATQVTDANAAEVLTDSDAARLSLSGLVWVVGVRLGRTGLLEVGG